MEYRRLGSSGLKVSRLWLGGMSFGAQKLRPWVLEEDESRAVIERALHHGINVIDTCDVYCAGMSEQIIGRYVKEREIRDRVILATKFGWPRSKNAALTQSGYSRRYMIEACENSLRNLRTDYIDIYQTHIWAPDTQIDEMVSAFDRLIQDGKIRYAGATDMPGWQFAKSLYVAKMLGKERFVSMQHHYNPIWREDERELMPLCRAENVALVPYSPLGRGFLSGDGTSRRAQTDDKISEWYDRADDRSVADDIRACAVDLDTSPAAVSLGWVLGTPGVVSTVVGPRSVQQLDELVASAGFVLPDEQRKRIDARYRYRVPRDSH